MKILMEASAGTLESSDALVHIGPAAALRLEIRSSVAAQFGDQIRAVVEDELAHLGVQAAEVSVDDKGALDFVLRARVKAAVLRAADARPDWSAL